MNLYIFLTWIDRLVAHRIQRHRELILLPRHSAQIRIFSGQRLRVRIGKIGTMTSTIGTSWCTGLITTRSGGGLGRLGSGGVVLARAAVENLLFSGFIVVSECEGQRHHSGYHGFGGVVHDVLQLLLGWGKLIYKDGIIRTCTAMYREEEDECFEIVYKTCIPLVA